MDRSEVAALKRWRRAGKKVLLVTGETPEQLCDFPHLELYDRVVAENGALLLHCGNHRETRLAKPPPERLVRALENAGLTSLKRGRLIFQAEPSDERKIERVLRELRSPWCLVHNRHQIMVVPPRVNKATGLAAILKKMKIRPEQVVAVGDAENDKPLFESCGLSVAVNNAVPGLKSKAGAVMNGSYGRGVAELIDWLLAAETKPKRKHAKSRTKKHK